MRRVGALVLAAALVAGCSSEDSDDGAPEADPGAPASSSTSASPSPEPSTDTGAGATTAPTEERPEADPDLALSEPVEDSVYPQVGDPGVDALHYDLTLDWDPETSTLTGREELLLRSTTTADRLQLDLSSALEVSSVTVDGAEVEHQHRGKDLVVRTPVVEDDRYVVEVAYAGTPEPAAAPTTRGDFSTTGWTITDEGETWTMQEPFGAYTWYAVNDHPSDKALYDFTITVPSPWVGVANGELTSRTEEDGVTRTTWHLAEPAASYLVTIATGEMTMGQDQSASGVPITYWTPTDQPRYADRLRATPRGLAWLEEKLGPYPYDTLGVLVVDSDSGMETQTMITLGANNYATSPEVLVHEMAHHWYGDQVTPDDWRDVWMNEGMAMYLQGNWEAEQQGVSVERLMDYWAGFEPDMRRESGPPADYDPAHFGSSNIYYGPALMWHELRQEIGDEAFWSMVRAWPQERDNGNAGRADYLPWLEERTGRELTAFFDAWLLGETTPPR